MFTTKVSCHLRAGMAILVLVMLLSVVSSVCAEPIDGTVVGLQQNDLTVVSLRVIPVPGLRTDIMYRVRLASGLERVAFVDRVEGNKVYLSLLSPGVDWIGREVTLKPGKVYFSQTARKQLLEQAEAMRGRDNDSQVLLTSPEK